MPARRLTGFTLIELSIVIMVLSLLAAAGLRYSATVSAASNAAALNKTLNAIEASLLSYRNTYSMLPCPADITQAENFTSFGVQTDTLADGNCTGANFNDGSNVYAGGVPTKTLRIDDKYAYDPWGRKILFAVDKRITASGAFTTYLVSDTTVIGAITIKKDSGDSAANAVTQKAIYSLVAFGPNGHGGYTRNPSATSVVFNAGSTNTNELQNCHCTSAAAAGTFDNIFIQATKTATTTLTNSFDDTVRFKTRAQMASYSELQ